VTRVALTGTGIQTSPIGFGCAALLGENSRSDALRILQTAFDSGVRFFDVAPSYGQGMAEVVLGEFAGPRRDQLVITTKFGIEPSLPSVARSSVIRKAARSLMKFSPRIRRLIGKASIGTLSTGKFSAQAARKSLERSLRSLRTDYIDILLLHECNPGDLRDSRELLDFLERMVFERKIFCFGTGTSVAATAAISQQFPAFMSVAQFANSVLLRSFDLVSVPGATINHGSLAGSFAALFKFLNEHPEVARTWSRELDADCGSPGVLSALMLLHAIKANAQGPVLFSSRSLKRIRETAELFNSKVPYSEEQLRRFAELAEASGVEPI
jgi:aryl-alcohol dehydrogenase-like predicted oxidoreductase